MRTCPNNLESNSKMNNILSDYETFKATMNKDEIMEWFQKRLNRAPEPFDVYQVWVDGSPMGRQP